MEVYANSTLYKDKEEMEALQLGAVQMLAPSLAKFGPLGVKEFEVFDLPFIFDNDAELHKVTQGPVGKKLLAKLEAKGIRGLALLGQRVQVVLGQQAAEDAGRLQGPEDAHPVVQGARGADARGRRAAAGDGVLRGLPGLQTGVVDGTENPHSNLYTQKMHEVQKHMTLTDHGYLGYAVIVNKKFWDGLPADVRGQLEQAMKEATDYANKIAKEENDAALEKVQPIGQDPDLQADAGRATGAEEGDGQGAQGDGVAHRQGDDRGGLQGDRLRSGQALALA